MTTLTPSLRPRSTERPRLTFGTTMASEWKKLLTVRSTVYSAVTLVFLAVAMVAIVALSYEPVTSATHPQELVGPSLAAGVSFSQLVMGILAVLIVTSEYTTGLIQSTLVSNPRRLSVLAAKAVVACVTAIVLGVVSWGLSALIGLPIFESKGYHASLTDPYVLGGLGTTVLYLFVVALFGVFVGSIVRSNAAGIAIVVGVLFVLPIIGNFLPESIDAAKYLVSDSTQTLALALCDDVYRKHVPEALVVTLSWLVVSGIGAVVLLRKRDV
ncbi:hypothetical protein [Frondihabitans cladoniiphilus]|uniref:ABC-2 type transport system permease protein n=1 Tax=Frondihabitans cladoniiphilus TaxID=715785 RepID=A0ABP8WDJ3_9MICO